MQVSHRIVRFASVGAVNTLIDIGIYTTLRSAGLPIVPVNLISTSCGLGVSFLLNSRFTFADRQLTKQRSVAYFVVTIFGLWILQPVIIFGASSLLKHALTIQSGLLVTLLPKLLATGCTMIWNYCWYNFAIYQKSP